MAFTCNTRLPTKGAANATKVTDLLYTLRALRWKDVVAPEGQDAARWGVDAPTLEIALFRGDGGEIATVVVGKLHLTILNGLAPWLGMAPTFQQPGWIPEVAFTWWAMIGALVVFAIGVLFRTPERVRAAIARHARQAELAESVPLVLRDQGRGPA